MMALTFDEIVHGNVSRLASYFPPDFKGVAVDVGAGDPDFLSNTKHFRERGWKVVSIEPNPELAKRFRSRGRPVLEYAVAEEEKDDVPFHVYSDVEGMSISALQPRIPHPGQAEKIIKVKTRRLDTILAEHHPEITKIDILDLDVEGWEPEVIRSLDFNRFKPDAVVVENIQFKKIILELMTLRGYVLADVFEWNEFYIRGRIQERP
jgi:FkbM family methyltransferase